MKENPILEKSFEFALRIIEVYKYLTTEKKEYVLSKQLLKAGTSIGANCQEANSAQSKRDFISKMSISLKEAEETKYWLKLLSKSGYLDERHALLDEIDEIIKILITIIKTARKNL